MENKITLTSGATKFTTQLQHNSASTPTDHLVWVSGAVSPKQGAAKLSQTTGQAVDEVAHTTPLLLKSAVS